MPCPSRLTASSRKSAGSRAPLSQVAAGQGPGTRSGGSTERAPRWHDGPAAGRPVSRGRGLARSTGPRSAVAGLDPSGSHPKGGGRETPSPFARRVRRIRRVPDHDRRRSGRAGRRRPGGRRIVAAVPGQRGAHRREHQGDDPERRATSADLELSWVGQVPGNLDWASPVIAGGSVYITGGDGGLVVFPKDGCGASTCDPSWTGNTGPQADATPAVVNGRVYVTSQANPNVERRPPVRLRRERLRRRPCARRSGRASAARSRSWSPRRRWPAASSSSARTTASSTRSTRTAADATSACRCGPRTSASTSTARRPWPAAWCTWGRPTGSSRRSTRTAAARRRARRCGGRGPRRRHRHRLADRRRRQGLRRHRPVPGRVRRDGLRRRSLRAAVARTRAAHREHAGRRRTASCTSTPSRSAQHFTSIGVVEAFDVDGCGKAAVPAAVDRHQLRDRHRVVAGDRERRRLRRQGPGLGLPRGLRACSATTRTAAARRSCAPLGFAQTGEQQFYLASSPAVVDGHVYMGSTDTPTDQAGLYVFALPGG